MTDNWPETKAAWVRLKQSVRDLWREIQLSRAQNHAIKAMNIYLENGCPLTTLRLAEALRKSTDEAP